MTIGVTLKAAVLFVDIARSTELRHRLGDEQAGMAISRLLDALAGLVVAERGKVIKSDGDDLIALFSAEPDFATDAALTAIHAQLLAQESGLSLYAGLHVGIVHVHEALGRRDIQGIAVNVAARLHKLVPDEPGSIYLAAETLALLSPALQVQASTYGRRLLKGIGEVAVCRLEWAGNQTVLPTQYAPTHNQAREFSLLVRSSSQDFRLNADDPVLVAGRSRSQSRLLIDEPVVSSRHLVFASQAGRWQVRDVSRNGSWLRDASATGGSEHLFRGETLLLPERGQICLGRAFANDPDGRLTLTFETLSLSPP